ncbi:DUF3047 domain-containing protein [Methyloceanibacter sp. wino2]|uniref:DUF3047 domain-containing protein n=1 Tax=Methyloceanibacter sp. wino2 TaxID=2170729 RepID=UPI00131EF894|nr:DUF3047 domain-containing protein [Methyloceanibacter sp. wino2]
MQDRPQLDGAAFEAQFTALLRNAPAGTVKDFHFVRVPSNQPPWLDTGIDIAPGDQVSTFAVGITSLPGTPISFPTALQLWSRIGPEGEIFRGTRATNSFEAVKRGRLYVGTSFPGEFATRTGGLAVPPEAYAMADGILTLLVVRWQVAPLEALKKLQTVGDVNGMVAAEIDRFATQVPVPKGWEYLWFIGPSEIYKECSDHGRDHAICCHSDNNGALLIKDCVVPLKPGTKVSWSWRMEKLPSEVREDTFPTHDYLSVAVEFDNGQDLTYFWSCELPLETTFRCPIPTWAERETHVVVRSGLGDLGKWLSEERDLYKDYAERIGGPMPQKIVKVWLIAVSIFQQTEGKCQFADIAVHGENGTIRVM